MYYEERGLGECEGDGDAGGEAGGGSGEAGAESLLIADGEVKVRLGSGLAGGEGEAGLLGLSTWKPTGCVIGNKGYIPKERGFMLLLACTRGYFELGRRPRGTLGASRRLSMEKGLLRAGLAVF